LGLAVRKKITRKKRITTLQIYQDLRQMIMDFDLFPGTRITETELAESFNVSRTPVREALQRLEVEGLLTIRPKQGCFVRPVDIETISEYYDVRVALEAVAVELACENMTDEQIDELLEFWNPKNYRMQLDYPEKVREEEEAFHVIIAEASGNPVLANYIKDVNDHIRIIRRLGFPDEKSIRETYEEHYNLCQLLKKRDTKKVKQDMIKHIRKSQGIARSVTLSQLQQHRKRSVKSKGRKLLNMES
jgi:DNA-binding GntR family transcriptional regulator